MIQSRILSLLAVLLFLFISCNKENEPHKIYLEEYFPKDERIDPADFLGIFDVISKGHSYFHSDSINYYISNCTDSIPKLYKRNTIWVRWEFGDSSRFTSTETFENISFKYISGCKYDSIIESGINTYNGFWYIDQIDKRVAIIDGGSELYTHQKFEVFKSSPTFFEFRSDLPILKLRLNRR